MVEEKEEEEEVVVEVVLMVLLRLSDMLYNDFQGRRAVKMPEVSTTILSTTKY